MLGTDDERRVSIDLLLIDDDSELREGLARYFGREGYFVSECDCGEIGIELAEQRAFDVIVVDMAMPGMDGLEVIRRLNERDRKAEIVMLTGEGSVEIAVEAMKLGARDFVQKPVGLKELDRLVRTAGNSRLLRKQNEQLKEVIKKHQLESPGIVGQSDSLLDVLRIVERTAKSDSPILIQGESGTGKELIARAVHQASTRADMPLVVINCAALPEPLLESELFGHEEGSFTGAVAAKPGLFEVADNGTLFIDEFGELAPAIQAKLLRVLEDGSLRRVGSITERRVNVRLIAATNRDLRKEVAEGRFREDLYYRINVLTLDLPPLRQRPGDIPLLVQYFVGPDWTIQPDVVPTLERYSWPGNIRQLKNALDRAMILADENVISVDNLPPEVTQVATPIDCSIPARPSELDTVSRLHVEEIFERFGGNKSRAARALGISRRSLYRLLEKYGIHDEFESD